jgi:hypothetical protein
MTNATTPRIRPGRKEAGWYRDPSSPTRRRDEHLGHDAGLPPPPSTGDLEGADMCRAHCRWVSVNHHAPLGNSGALGRPVSRAADRRQRIVAHWRQWQRQPGQRGGTYGVRQ